MIRKFFRSHTSQYSLSSVFALWTIQGVGVLCWLAGLPTSAEKGLLFGYSSSRLGLLAVALLLTFASAWLYSAAHRHRLQETDLPQKSIYIITLLVSLSAPMIMIILYALAENGTPILNAYASRILPLACWFTLSGLEMALALGMKNKELQITPAKRSYLQQALIALSALAAIALFIRLSGSGITPYNDGSWGTPTTPLLEWQILLAVLSALVFFALEERLNLVQYEAILPISIYLLTCLLWLSQPANPGYFATPPREPNFEIYPFSDALIYAQYAQSALVGNGFIWPEVPTRPLYITFLTWLHAIGGQNYTQVIALQTLVLAAFPAVLYLIGKELLGRPLGIGMAILAILRDVTANISAPFALNYTYTKLYFSEIPAALLISIFTLLIIRWMRQEKPAWYTLMAGGILGLASLVRLQSGILISAVALVAFFVIKNRTRWFWGMFWMAFGIILAIIPWVARNYVATGGIVLDNPISQTMVLARRWGGDNGNELIPRLPDEGDAQYSSRMSALALANLKKDPGRIIGSAVNHFFNNEIANLLIFPLRDKLENPKELLWPERAFWQSWRGKATAGQIPFIVFYTLLAGLGLASAFQKSHLTGLLPLALSLIYNAWTALFLSSGDRFLVPIDWTTSMYLFLGLFTLSSLILTGRLPSQNPAEIPAQTPAKQNIKALILTGMIIAFLGASIPLTELAFPKLYPESITAAQKESATPLEIRVRGRAIYPRWYDAGDGEPGSAKLGYGKDTQARLVFFLTGETNSLVIFSTETPPAYFPHASDVSIEGTIQNGVIFAEKITVKTSQQTVEYTH